MSTFLRVVPASLLFLLPAARPSHAQVSVQVNAPSVRIAAPSVRIAAPTVVVPPPPAIVFAAPPPLVVVEPGVQVVPDYDEEVYFVEGAYWVRRGHHWYRSDDHRGGWVVAQGGAPRPLARIKVGKYRRWHPRGPAVVVTPPPGRTVVVEPGDRRHERDHERGHGRGHGHGHDRDD